MFTVRTLALFAAMVAAIGVVSQDPGTQQPVDQQSERRAANDGTEILTRGPIHEAFAVSMVVEAKAGPTAAKAPPAPLEELPPDQKPEGEDVQWISGYWSWDDERTDFIWVSGAWRVPPADHQWIPGTWHDANGRWQWTSGFWLSLETKKVEYLPPPPPAPESVPAVQSPGEGHVYAPGIWVYHDGRYQWRPGYWVAPQDNWVYCPAHYVWTSAGVIFVEGYWDYPLESRGLLFAPVYLNANVYSQQDYVYRPSYVLYDTALLGAMFVRPGYSSYYFGDYFDRRYTNLGYRPWVDYRQGHAIDPLWAYYRHSYGTHDRNWVTNMNRLYQGRVSGEIPRPARTFAEQTQLFARAGSGSASEHNAYLSLAAPLRSVDSNFVRLTQIDQNEQQRLSASVREMRQFGEQRVKLEGTSNASGRRQSQAVPFDLPRSPVRSASGSDASRSQGSGDQRTGGTPSNRASDQPGRADSKADAKGNRPDQPNDRPDPKSKAPTTPPTGKSSPPPDRPDTSRDRPQTPSGRDTPPKSPQPQTPDRPQTPSGRDPAPKNTPPRTDRPDTPKDRPQTPSGKDAPPKSTQPQTPERPQTPAGRDPAPQNTPPRTPDRPQTPGKTEPKETPKATSPSQGNNNEPQRPTAPPPRSPQTQQPKSVPQRPTPPPPQNPPQKTPQPPTKEKGKEQPKEQSPR